MRQAQPQLAFFSGNYIREGLIHPGDVKVIKLSVACRVNFYAFADVTFNPAGLGEPFVPEHLMDDARGCIKVIRQSMPRKVYSALDTFLLSAFGTAWAIHKRVTKPLRQPGSSLGCRRRPIIMSYVQSVLQSGEKVRHISSIHWILYWPGVAAALLAMVAYLLSETQRLTGLWQYTAYALALVAVVLLIQQWFQSWVTEIAVTNRRVIYKKGLIRRQTNEMNMDKVESVKVDQSILGRMLDYGNVTVLGTGEGFGALRTIASPIELRNSIITGTTRQA